MNLKPSEKVVLMNKALQKFIDVGKGLEFELELYDGKYKNVDISGADVTELKSLTKIIGELYNNYNFAFKNFSKYKNVAHDYTIHEKNYNDMCKRISPLINRWGWLKFNENNLKSELKQNTSLNRWSNNNIPENINRITSKTIKKYNQFK